MSEIENVKERVTKDLTQRLKFDLFVKCTENEKTQIIIEIDFFVKNGGPRVVGIFKDPLFNDYTEKIAEVLLALVVLVQEESPLAKGKFQIQASDGFTSLSYESEPALASSADSYNAYGAAFRFLRGENILNYLHHLN